jgi:hypothetical protein
MKENCKTEAEARKLWCPMVRVIDYNCEPIVAHSRYRSYGDEESPSQFYPSPVYCHCIASECAMWRWTLKETGYCGLAGVPS